MHDGRIPIVVTMHAIRRYRERVAKVPARIIVERLSWPAFDLCDAMGGGAVILPTGHRAVCGNGAVITILPHGRKFMGFVGKHRR